MPKYILSAVSFNLKKQKNLAAAFADSSTFSVYFRAGEFIYLQVAYIFFPGVPLLSTLHKQWRTGVVVIDAKNRSRPVFSSRKTLPSPKTLQVARTAGTKYHQRFPFLGFCTNSLTGNFTAHYAISVSVISDTRYTA